MYILDRILDTKTYFEKNQYTQYNNKKLNASDHMNPNYPWYSDIIRNPFGKQEKIVFFSEERCEQQHFFPVILTGQRC
jgi:hypothetical protein